ncbi:MAG: amidohydrolase [Rhizobacter sp.]|nr:amidohydrolase [Rhizobacter sp.]
MQTTGCSCCAYQQPISAKPVRLAAAFKNRSGPARSPLSASATAATASSRALLLHGGTVVDPRDGSAATNVDVLIRAGRIVELSPSGTAGKDPLADRVDATGRFIVPGYNDMHSHALNLGDPSGSLALMLAEGVTGFRQMSGSPMLLQQKRANALPIGPAAPALLETPGSILTPLNAGSKEAAAEEIRRQHAQGADFVKIVLVSPEVFMAAVNEAAGLGISILGHLQEGVDVVAACRAGFRSVEHLGPGSPVWASCSALGDELHQQAAQRQTAKAPPFKIPFLERIVAWRMQNLLVNPAAFSEPADVARIQRALDTYSDDRAVAVAEQLADLDTWQVPTLVRLRSMQYAGAPEYERDEMLAYLPEKNVKRWRKVTKKFLGLPIEARDTYRALYPRQLGLTKLFADHGVSMMTGTDGGSMMAPGLTLRQEFAELAKAGLSPLKVLQMTTINAAEYVGQRDTMGTVEPGRNADLVVLDADPLEDVGNLHRISAVIRAGRHYSATELAALKAQVAAAR